MEGKRQPPARDRGMLRHPEQLLHADVERGRARRFIVDRVAVAGRGLKVRRRFFVQPPLQVPGQERIERRAEIVCANLG